MIFDAYAFVEKLESGTGDVATTATTATNTPGNRPNVAVVAVVATVQGQNSKYADALDQASERAAIMQYDGDLPLAAAERAAALAASKAWGVPVAVILAGLQKTCAPAMKYLNPKGTEQ